METMIAYYGLISLFGFFAGMFIATLLNDGKI